MDPLNSKFPYTRADIAYGFRQGIYKIPTILSGVPDQPPKPGESKIVVNESVAKHWFWFDGGWVEVMWDSLLDPANLRFRRLFNEALAERHIDFLNTKKMHCKFCRLILTQPNYYTRKQKTLFKMGFCSETCREQDAVEKSKNASKDTRKFVYIRTGIHPHTYINRHHNGHSVEKFKDGFYCKDCCSGVREAMPKNKIKFKNELNNTP